MENIDEGISFLRNRCAVLKRIIDAHGPYRPNRPADPFTALVRSIMGQQLSVKAAATIYGRLLERAGGELSAETLNAIPDEDFRACGVSRQKLGYLRDLSRHFVESPETFSRLPELSDEEVIKALTAVKGIGVWTAQMFLMFTLHRPDVFAPDDVGLQNAMKRWYDWETPPDKKALVAKAEDWAPWRTVACWYLWQSLDNEPG